MYNFLSLLILIFSLLNLLSAGRVPGLTTNLSLTRCGQQTALDVDFLMDLRMSHLFVQFFFATAVRAYFFMFNAFMAMQIITRYDQSKVIAAYYLIR